MDNPLSDEQIQKINEISKLPSDKQQPELQKFLKTLTPEQFEFLKKQQGSTGGGCPFCGIAQGKIPSKAIYEDADFMAVLDINPATKGHVLVMPKEHFSNTTQMPDPLASKMFLIANKVAKHVFDAVKAEGTNIFVGNGQIAGQHVDHVIVHVIPRFQDDKINFTWAGKKADEAELNQLQQQLRGTIKLESVAKEEAPKEVADEDNMDDLIP